MVMSIERPKLEGNIAVGEDRQISFAEFGNPQATRIKEFKHCPVAQAMGINVERYFALGFLPRAVAMAKLVGSLTWVRLSVPLSW